MIEIAVAISISMYVGSCTSLMFLFVSCRLLLQAEARDHFGCPTLEGVELENQGGSGTAISHWEKRILGVCVCVCMCVCVCV